MKWGIKTEKVITYTTLNANKKNPRETKQKNGRQTEREREQEIPKQQQQQILRINISACLRYNIFRSPNMLSTVRAIGIIEIDRETESDLMMKVNVYSGIFMCIRVAPKQLKSESKWRKDFILEALLATLMCITSVNCRYRHHHHHHHLILSLSRSLHLLLCVSAVFFVLSFFFLLLFTKIISNRLGQISIHFNPFSNRANFHGRICGGMWFAEKASAGTW